VGQIVGSDQVLLVDVGNVLESMLEVEVGSEIGWLFL